MRALYSAATGMAAQELNVQVISNNIANLRTTGYKRQQVHFQDLLYQNLRRAGSSTSEQNTQLPAGLALGSGVKTTSTARVMSQGTLSSTEKDYDVAIRGEGLFRVTMPDGRTAYTRDGSFDLSASGQLVTRDGYLLDPAITVPQTATAVTISATGAVQATLPGQTAPQALGQFQLSRFVNKVGLESIGDNLFIETAASGPAISGLPGAEGFGNLQQSYLEEANVNAVTEISVPDRRAARLRDELEGRHRRRPDALHHHADVPQLTAPAQVPDDVCRNASRPRLRGRRSAPRQHGGGRERPQPDRPPSRPRVAPLGAAVLLRAMLAFLTFAVLGALAIPAIARAEGLRLRGDVTARGDVLTLADLVEGAPAALAARPLFRSPALGATGNDPDPAHRRRGHRPRPRRTGDRRPAADRGSARRPPPRAAGDRGRAQAEPADRLRARPAQRRGPVRRRRPDPAGAGRSRGPRRGPRPDLRSALAPGRGLSAWASGRRRCGSPAWSSSCARWLCCPRADRGEPVKEGDVVMERRPRDAVAADAQASATAILGEVAQHALTAGTVLRVADTAPPELVARGENVTIVYETPSISLSMRGIANEGGPDGGRRQRRQRHLQEGPPGDRRRSRPCLGRAPAPRPSRPPPAAAGPDDRLPALSARSVRVEEFLTDGQPHRPQPARRRADRRRARRLQHRRPALAGRRDPGPVGDRGSHDPARLQAGADADARRAAGLLRAEFALAHRLPRLLQGPARRPARRPPDREGECHRSGEHQQRDQAVPRQHRELRPAERPRSREQRRRQVLRASAARRCWRPPRRPPTTAPAPSSAPRP